MQSRLQSEIDNLYSHLHSSGKQHPTWDEISNLSYLSAVVNETLRIVPAAPALFRVAEQDDVIPLSRPVPRADGKGMLSHINVPKGTSITIGLKAANLDPEIWGADADEFKPERWLDPARARRASLSTTTASSPTDEKSSSELQTPSQSPAQAQAQEHTPASLAPTSANGLWTFSSGPKMCIGYRFANVEIKVLAMTMLRAYTVESVEELVIRQKDGIVVRPEIRGREKEGRQLPLRFVKRGAAAGQKEKERESASADA